MNHKNLESQIFLLQYFGSSTSNLLDTPHDYRGIMGGRDKNQQDFMLLSRDIAKTKFDYFKSFTLYLPGKCVTLGVLESFLNNDFFIYLLCNQLWLVNCNLNVQKTQEKLLLVLGLIPEPSYENILMLMVDMLYHNIYLSILMVYFFWNIHYL